MNLRRLQIDAFGCGNRVADVEAIEQAMLEGASLAGADVRQNIAEPFNPHGATLVLILAESHFIVSTWPELGYVTIDAALCNDEMDIDLLIKPVLSLLNPVRSTQTRQLCEVSDAASANGC